jgi:hypothetical protein
MSITPSAVQFSVSTMCMRVLLVELAIRLDRIGHPESSVHDAVAARHTPEVPKGATTRR